MGRKKKTAAANQQSQPRPAHYDIDHVRSYARGQWPAILSHFGVPYDVLDGNHHKCPKSGCPSTRDAFRFTDRDGDGSILCNQCCRTEAGNGFLALSWWTGKPFYDCLVMVAEHLNVPPSNASANYKKNGKDDHDPADHLKFEDCDPADDPRVALWCMWKPPIIPVSINLAGGRIARYTYYDKSFTVIALPVWGEKLKGAEPVGWSIWNISGHNLPKKGGWVKVKLTAGSKEPGLIGPVDQIASATTVWKLEGPSDLLAFYSLPDIPDGVVAVTNKAGAGEKPADWIPDLFAGKMVNVMHDADKPGQDGSVAWLNAISRVAAETYAVTLPYEVLPDHGKDLRDFLQEKLNVAHNPD